MRIALAAIIFAARAGVACSQPAPAPTTPTTPTGSGSAVAPVPVDAPAPTDDEKLAAIQKAMNELDEASQTCWAIAATDRFDIEGELVGRQQGSEFHLDTLELSSSLGSVAGTGSFHLTAFGSLDTADAEFSIQLTEEGRKKIGGYLALAAQRRPDSPDKNWVAALEKRRGSPPRWTVRVE